MYAHKYNVYSIEKDVRTSTVFSRIQTQSHVNLTRACAYGREHTIWLFLFV